MTGHRILLVDDETDFVEALSARLIKRGFTTDLAYDGAEAIEKVRATDYDAVVLDIAMPRVDGITALSRILEIDRDLQVILLTGHGTVHNGIEAMKRGASNFVQKPVDFDEFLSKLQQAANNKLLLIAKRSEAEVAEILRRKGW